MEKDSIENKRNKEKEVIELMIRIYCDHKHEGEPFCSSCRELLDYSIHRIDHCPFMEDKTYCSNCKVHCFNEEMRASIREVMRFSGPRMLVHHPIMAIDHVFQSLKQKLIENKE